VLKMDLFRDVLRGRFFKKGCTGELTQAALCDFLNSDRGATPNSLQRFVFFKQPLGFFRGGNTFAAFAALGTNKLRGGVGGKSENYTIGPLAGELPTPFLSCYCKWFQD